MEALGLNITDWFILVVLTASGLISLARGFTKEFLSLFLWVVAFIAAVSLEYLATPKINEYIGNEEVSKILSYIVVFVVCIILGGMVIKFIGTLIKWFFIGIVFGVLDFGYVLMKLLLVLIVAPVFDSFNSCLPNNRLFFPNIFWSFRNVILTIINLLIIFNAIDNGLPGEWITGYIAALVLIYFKFMKKKDPKAGLNRREVATLNMS